jgi:hypothetical protein
MIMVGKLALGGAGIHQSYICYFCSGYQPAQITFLRANSPAYQIGD